MSESQTAEILRLRREVATLKAFKDKVRDLLVDVAQDPAERMYRVLDLYECCNPTHYCSCPTSSFVLAQPSQAPLPVRHHLRSIGTIERY